MLQSRLNSNRGLNNYLSKVSGRILLWLQKGYKGKYIETLQDLGILQYHNSPDLGVLIVMQGL